MQPASIIACAACLREECAATQSESSRGLPAVRAELCAVPPYHTWQHGVWPAFLGLVDESWGFKAFPYVQGHLSACEDSLPWWRQMEGSSAECLLQAPHLLNYPLPRLPTALWLAVLPRPPEQDLGPVVRLRKALCLDKSPFLRFPISLKTMCI